MSTEKNSGLGLGALAAAVFSIAANHSIFWALIHGIFCGWFYVIYFLLIKYGSVHEAIEAVKRLF